MGTDRTFQRNTPQFLTVIQLSYSFPSLPSNMNRHLLKLIKNNLLPPLLPTFHKGQLGRLAVIGGCEDYTGAPFFSAHAAMLAGVDLVHVICDEGASQVIKGYSPDLMVHPYMCSQNDAVIDERMDKIKTVLSRIDVVILGPGFGRNSPTMLEFLREIADYAQGKGIPLILDADALYHLSVDEKLQTIVGKSDNKNIVLTPNVMELKRLCDAFNVDDDIQALSRNLKCTVIAKGSADRISYHGSDIIKCDEPGSLKRVGGQGDSLTGMVGAFLCWGTGAYKKGLYATPDKLSDEDIVKLSCLGGCTATRRAGHAAYTKYGRSMLTSNLHEFISNAYNSF